jgi:hypothetical protein
LQKNRLRILSQFFALLLLSSYLYKAFDLIIQK